MKNVGEMKGFSIYQFKIGDMVKVRIQEEQEKIMGNYKCPWGNNVHKDDIFIVYRAEQGDAIFYHNSQFIYARPFNDGGLVFIHGMYNSRLIPFLKGNYEELE
jgi:hypothetical protein